MTDRSRSWCFTINNPELADTMECLDLDARYKVFGFEIGKKGTPHIQGYVYYDDAKSMKSMKRKLTRAHLEIARGTPQQASDYCKKDGDFYEYGEVPVKGKLQFTDIENVMNDPESNFSLYNQYRRAYKDYVNSKKKQTEKVRRFEIIPHKYRFYFAKKHEYGSVFMDEDISTYDNEEVFISSKDYIVLFNVQNWLQGFPARERRGYEIVYVDPSIVYFTYDSPAQYNYLIKTYSDYIDKVWLQKEIEDLERKKSG